MLGIMILVLKEWVFVIKVLENGCQILVMCKGGIVEEIRYFELKSLVFYLYLIYEYQCKELIKFFDYLYVEELLVEWVFEVLIICIIVYVEVIQDLEIRDQEMLD